MAEQLLADLIVLGDTPTGGQNVLGVSCTCIKKHQNWMKKEQFQKKKQI